MKIVHILAKGVIGGAEKLSLNLAKQQMLKENTVSMWFLFDGGPIQEEAEKSGIKTHNLCLKSSFDFTGFFKFYKAIESFAPQIIHVHSASVVILYLKLLKRNFGIVLHQHDLGLSSMGRIKKKIFKHCKDVPDIYIGVSQHIVKLIEQDYALNKNKINLVYNGIDLAGFKASKSSSHLKEELGLGNNVHLVGSVGRVVVQKGFDYFIKSARIIKNACPDTHFVLIGDGPERNKLEGLAEQLGLQNCISFLGMRNDVPDLLSGFDIFLMTSRFEPFGIVLLEALASGVPTVSFDVGGIPEIIESKYGIIVQQGDFQSLAHHTIDLLKNKAQRDDIIANGLEHVKKFDIIKIAESINGLYMSVLN